MYDDEIAVKMQALPDSLKQEALDFIDFLLSKKLRKKANKEKFKFDWEGGLADIGNEMSSVELSHRSMEWR
jgi:hypothetical protein